MAAQQPPPQYAPQPQYAQPPQQYAPQPEPQYAPAPAPAAPSQDEVIKQLTQLGELHANGILTDDEFAAQKAKILGT